MRITVNGDAMQARPGETLAALVARLGLDARKVAVERNLEIAPRSQYDRIALQEGDRIEIVQFVGGG
ncbi:MAG: sulfur carrier protein ThiS [Maricaulaceae bacterium]|nr:sulfur carrier protein ThiS [Maricaulaceae bacterium]